MSADPGAALERIARAQQARRRKFYLRDEKITMSHGSGGKATHNLIEGVFGLGAETGLTFPPTLVFTYPAPTALAAHLDERLALADGGTATADDTERVLAEIERLDTALAAVEPGFDDHTARARVVKRLESVLWRWTSTTAPTADGPGDWPALLAGCGLRLDRIEIVDRELEVDEWLPRAHPPPENAAKVRAMLDAAARGETPGLAARYVDGRLRFTLGLQLLRARPAR